LRQRNAGITGSRRRKMVIRDQYLQSQLAGMGHAFKAGNAVVNGDQQLRAGICHPLSDRGRQTVAVHHPVWYQVRDLFGP